MTNTPKRGVFVVTWLVFDFDAHDYMSGIIETRFAKFGMQAEYIKC